MELVFKWFLLLVMDSWWLYTNPSPSVKTQKLTCKPQRWSVSSKRQKSDREKMIILISPWNSFRLSISEYYGPRPAVSTFVNLYITNKVNFSFEIYCCKYLKKVVVFSNHILLCLLLGIGQVEFSSLGFGFGFFFHIAQIRFTITGLLIILRELRILFDSNFNKSFWLDPSHPYFVLLNHPMLTKHLSSQRFS